MESTADSCNQTQMTSAAEASATGVCPGRPLPHRPSADADMDVDVDADADADQYSTVTARLTSACRSSTCRQIFYIFDIA